MVERGAGRGGEYFSGQAKTVSLAVYGPSAFEEVAVPTQCFVDVVEPLLFAAKYSTKEPSA